MARVPSLQWRVAAAYSVLFAMGADMVSLPPLLPAIADQFHTSVVHVTRWLRLECLRGVCRIHRSVIGAGLLVSAIAALASADCGARQHRAPAAVRGGMSA